MKTDDMIAVLQAFKAGNRLQFRICGKAEEWETFVEGLEPSWNFNKYEYRIKPEPPKPREFWVPPGPVMPVFVSEQPIEGWLHVREVLP